MKPNTSLSPSAETRPVVVFIHVPKTGGTTLKMCFKKRFLKSVFYINKRELEKDFSDRSQEEKDELDYIHGHIPTGVVHHAVSRPCVYLSMFRDPLAKAVSNYAHIIQWPKHRWHKRFIEKQITLEKFLTEHDDIRDFLLDNPTTRCFSDPRETHDEQPMTPELVRRVKTTLREQFTLIGLTERFTDSIFLFCRRLEIPVRLYLKHNVTRRLEKTADLRPEVITRFKEHNWADYEVYDFAKQLFERQWDKLDEREKRRAGRYRRIQNLFKAMSFKALERRQ